MAYRVQSMKPKLKKLGKEVDFSEENVEPALSYDSSSDIIMFSEESWPSIILNWVKTFFKFIGVTALILSLLYVILASTVLFMTRVDGDFNLVARGTFMGGQPSAGEVVLTSSTTPVSTDMLNKLTTGLTGVDAARIMTVLADANDTVTVTPEGVTLPNGVSVIGDTSSIETQGEVRLVDQVLVQCITGACDPEAMYIQPLSQVYGEVQNPAAEKE